jgi:hypothetical protein
MFKGKVKNKNKVLIHNLSLTLSSQQFQEEYQIHLNQELNKLNYLNQQQQQQQQQLNESLKRNQYYQTQYVYQQPMIYDQRVQQGYTSGVYQIQPQYIVSNEIDQNSFLEQNLLSNQIPNNNILSSNILLNTNNVSNGTSNSLLNSPPKKKKKGNNSNEDFTKVNVLNVFSKNALPVMDESLNNNLQDE